MIIQIIIQLHGLKYFFDIFTKRNLLSGQGPDFSPVQPLCWVPLQAQSACMDLPLLQTKPWLGWETSDPELRQVMRLHRRQPLPQLAQAARAWVRQEWQTCRPFIFTSAFTQAGKGQWGWKQALMGTCGLGFASPAAVGPFSYFREG